jgi:3-hydroxyacyl-CoA dehydrogenase/3-hydroxy-2-methylbutyryl-CoA dehydrogenase
MKIEGAVIVVTGGASGLGEATCRAVIAGGGKAVILDMNEQKGNALAAELGQNSLFLKCNVLKEESIDECIDQVMAKMGRIDGNVNCAGGAMPGTGLTVNKHGEAHKLEAFKNTVLLNVVGTFALTSKCAAKMALNQPVDEEGERGCIINVASVAAQDGQNGQAAYAAGKGGIVAMTLPIARDLGKRGIRVNTIMPGVFETPMTEPMKKHAPKVYKNLTSSNVFPTTRLGLPHEFSHLAIAILENKYMNGGSIRLDGGLRMSKL